MFSSFQKITCSCFVVVVVIVFCFCFGISFFISMISQMVSNTEGFFFQDGDENAIEGNGEEQQGPQKTKKVRYNNSLIYGTVKLIVCIIYSLLEM